MKNIFLIAFFGLILACSNQAEKPSELIVESDMVLILADVHKLEAKLSRMKVKNDSLVKVYNTFELELLKAHGVSKKKYQESFEYYMSQPEIMEKIYEVVVDSLNVTEQEATMAKENTAEASRVKYQSSRDSLKTKSDVKGKRIKPVPVSGETIRQKGSQSKLEKD